MEHRADFPPKLLTKRAPRLNDAQAALRDGNLFLPGSAGVARVTHGAGAVLLVALAVLLTHPLKQPLRCLWDVVRVTFEGVFTLVLAVLPWVGTKDDSLAPPQDLPTLMTCGSVADVSNPQAVSFWNAEEVLTGVGPWGLDAGGFV